MDQKGKTRFLLNMRRIHGLVRVLHFDHPELKPSAILQSDGVRADILRSIVVFLHATFEEVVRSRIPQRYYWNFSSKADLDKALNWARIDARSFKNLYPTLTQLAKRRNRVVHNADFPTVKAMIAEPWELHDTWQLVMWMMAVSAFYYQLCISADDATIVEKAAYQNHLNAMHEWVKVARAFIEVPQLPPDRLRDSIQEIADMVKRVMDILPLDANALIAEPL